MDIVQGCKLNNRRAQTLLFNKLHTKLINQAKLYFNDPDMDVIDDIVQESFIVVFSDIQNFKGLTIKDFHNYISVIIKNKCMDIHRLNKKYTIVELYDNIIDHTVDDFLYTDYIPYIERVINKLNNNHKIAIEMYYLENKKHKEISETLGITENNSKKVLFEAKKKLKHYFLELKKQF